MRLAFPATLLVFLAALWVKAVYPASSGIADLDFWWHVEYGRWILAHRELPAGDIFSWTMPGTPYQLTQWLGEVLLGAAYETWGLHGTKALSVGLSAITIGFSWLAARRYVHTSYALGIALLCNLVAVVTPMRPQLFTFALLSVMGWIGAVLCTGGHRRIAWAFVPLMALWVNLHGGYIVGIGFLGLLCLGFWIEAWPHARFGDRNARRFTGVCALAALATLANPYGVGAWQAVAMIGGLHSSSLISEWKPVDPTTEMGWFYLLNLVPYVALLLAGSRPRAPHALLAGAFLFFGVLANRQEPMMAAVMAPLTAALLAKAPQYLTLWRDARNPSRPIAFGAVTALLVLAFPWLQARGDARWDATINGWYPVNASAFMSEHGFTRRVFCDTTEGSYLIHAGIPVFIDGRMDLYRDRFFFDYYFASKGAAGWERLLDRYLPETMLLRNDMAIRQLAMASGRWKLVFEDDRYSVLRPASDDTLPALTPRPIRYLDESGRLVRNYLP